MQPRAYVDIEVISGNDTGISAPVLRSRLMAILHGCFRNLPGCYAIALPQNDRSRIRIFADSRQAFDPLVDAMQSSRWLRDYGRIGYAREVPSDFNGPWVAFRRYRIPTARSDRSAVDGVSHLRDRRIEQAKQRGLEFFHTRSTGSQQAFLLTVERVDMDGPTADCTPNSYGLGSTNNTFAVPDLS